MAEPSLRKNLQAKAKRLICAANSADKERVFLEVARRYWRVMDGYDPLALECRAEFKNTGRALEGT